MERKIIKDESDFGGYWVKNIKNFKGHEGETLFQCSVYKDGKRIGFFSEDSRGGPAQLQNFSKKDEEELINFAKKWEGENAWSESYSTFITDIVNEVENIKQYKTKCKTKVLFITKDCKEDEHRFLKFKYEKDPLGVRKYLDEKYGDYIIINDLV